jgi:hypothetical protein
LDFRSRDSNLTAQLFSLGVISRFRLRDRTLLGELGQQANAGRHLTLEAAPKAPGKRHCALIPAQGQGAANTQSVTKIKTTNIPLAFFCPNSSSAAPDADLTNIPRERVSLPG